MTALSLEGVSRRFGAVNALADVSLAVPAGSRTAILGPSGSGKSTLLRIVAGFEVPDTGRVLLGDTVIADGPMALPAHRRGIGLVAQEGALFPHLTVADNIGFGLPRRAPDRAARIAALVAMVGLDAAMLARKPDELSGGQQQRVALARALACQPRLMLLDEPFSALDTGLRAATRQAVSDLLGAAGVTTILVTHDQEEALSFADQLAVMRDGRLVQSGPPREVYLRPRDAMIARFLGEAVLLPARIAGAAADCLLGQVPVPPGAAAGATRIMLRPEQLGMVPDPAGLAEVVAISFGGQASRVTLALPDGHRLVLTRSWLDAPAVGTRLRLTVAGEAHPLA